MAKPGSIRFLVNPASGRGTGRAHVDRIRVLASRHGAGLVVTRKVSDLWEQARRAAEDGVERLLVAGGDGTMHLAIQGLAGTACALGVIPLGTGNDFAGTLAVPPELEPAVERAITGEIRSIDLLRVGETYSVSYAGVGFDSEVTRYANEGVKFLRGPLVYFYSVIHTLITFEPPRMRVVHDGGTFEGKVMFAVVNNLPRFGGGMRIAPDAKIDDGLLDLVIVKEVPKSVLLSIFPKVYTGKHVGHPAVQIVRTKRAEITIDRALTMYGGGEPLRPMTAGEPVAVEVVPGGLRVVG
ncbi:MAG TPA: diacylglycerol kinase family protein [Thermoanaerobaculia bacterium]|jgi:diacylglycerol kinase (ATP)|nr:diacylglycerol kinase family protein [Thermoanaerobaculia bacterium]